jgi:predicted ATPase
MGQLPSWRSTLIGRTRERDDLTFLLKKPGSALVTLTGPGGTGKTRLAVETAQSLASDFEHGVWFVNLAPLSDSAMVPSAIAHVLGLQQGARGLAERLHEFLRDRSVLLILDNFETVLSAAPQVAALLAGARRLKLVVTSRARLALPDELELAVPPLDIETDSVRLFLERAMAADPSFSVNASTASAVAQICTRLDGLPLALELAASRMKLLGGPKELLDRMEGSALSELFQDEGRSRHRTLRATISWSYRLLSSSQQLTFTQLSIFRGGFTRDAAAALCGEAAREDLEVLKQHNLLREDAAGRLDMLETVHEFAVETLEQAGVIDAIRERHAAQLSRFARELGERLGAAATAADLDRVEAELDNIRAALEHFERRGLKQPGLELITALGRFYDIRGYWMEGRRWLTAFAAAGTEPHLRARALNLAGVIAFRQGDFPAAKALHEEALTLGDVASQLDAVDRLQWVAMYQGRTAEGVALAQKGWPMADALGDLRRRARARGQLAWAAFEQGQREKAESLYAEAVAELEQQPDLPDLAYMLNALGEVHRGRAHYREARETYERSLELSRKVGVKRQMAPCLYNLAAVARSVGDRDTALKYLLESLQLTQEIGNLHNLPLDLFALANLVALKGNAKVAAQIIGAAEAMMKRIGVEIVFADKDDYESAVSLVRAHLGANELEKLRSEGAKLSADAAIRLGLEAVS